MNLNDYAKLCHEHNKGWWIDLDTGLPKDRNVGEMLMLIVGELSEAMEGYRKELDDEHIPTRKAFEVELADTVIRIFDLCGGLSVDLDGAFVDKMAYNLKRADHKLENRRLHGGKKL